MATEQDKAMIDQLAGQKLGDANAQAGAQQAPQQAPQQEAAPPPEPKDAPPTDQEKAAATLSPTTEGDNSLEQSVKMFEVDFGGEKRNLTEAQIRETFNRYRDLNYRHANEIKPIEPAMKFVQDIMSRAKQSGKEINGNDMAQFLQAATQAFVSNPTMGNQKDPTPDSQGQRVTNQRNLQSEIEDQIKRWEEENAVTLPPMYRDGFARLEAMGQENAQLRQMMNQFLASAQGINQDAAQAAVSAEQAQQQAYRTQAANNLNAAQQQYGLPDADEDDFFSFAFERGFTIEDFIDRDLTEKVMGDFAAVKNTPEMERLRSMAQRRQAYTGATSSAPGSAGEPSKPNADQDFMNTVAEAAMRKRNML